MAGGPVPNSCNSASKSCASACSKTPVCSSSSSCLPVGLMDLPFFGLCRPLRPLPPRPFPRPRGRPRPPDFWLRLLALPLPRPPRPVLSSFLCVSPFPPFLLMGGALLLSLVLLSSSLRSPPLLLLSLLLLDCRPLPFPRPDRPPR